MSSIVTFYSFKGGVGRTMALANIAVILARMGLKVLAVDWDLEAPGLIRYFRDQKIVQPFGDVGLLDLLVDAYTSSKNQAPNWRNYLSLVDIGDEKTLSVITSGKDDASYIGKVLDFDWNFFFENCDGGNFIESLRDDWRKEFDITLIDSRTGITDSGGICTIQLPDILTLVFTANYQSVRGVKDVALRSQQARQTLDFDRMPLLVYPLPSRFDSRAQFEESQQWINIFGKEFSLFYSDWLPKQVASYQVIERTKLPYIAYFSFGEKLPVVTHGTSDPEGLGYAYLASATLIANDFKNAENLVSTDISLTPQVSSFNETSVELDTIKPIKIDLDLIDSINSDLAILNNLRSQGLLNDERKLSLFNNANEKLKKLTNITRDALEEIKTIFQRLLQEIIIELQERLVDLSSRTTKELEISTSQQIDLLRQFTAEIQEARTIAEWIDERRSRLAELIGKYALYENPIPEEALLTRKLEAFYFSIEQFLEILSHCLTWGNSSLLETPEIPKVFEDEFYISAFNRLKEIIPRRLPEEGKEQLDEYIGCLLENLPFCPVLQLD